MVGGTLAELDPGKVERIVENLLINAARHTPKEAAIWVIVEDQEDGVLISVDDSGPGIPADIRPILFEPFSKGKRGPYAPGLGIGLSLVWRSLHRGGPLVVLAGHTDTVPPQGNARAERTDDRVRRIALEFTR